MDRRAGKRSGHARRRAGLAVGVALFLALATIADAQELEQKQSPAQRNILIPDLAQAEEWLTKREYLTGDWGGLRSKLNDLGIIPTLTFVTDVLANPVGGMRSGVRESDNFGLDLAIDLERLIGWTGATFDTSFALRSGTSLSSDNIGNAFEVAQVCCGHTYRLVNVYLEQSLFGDALNIRVGRMATGDEFLTSPLYWNFLQTGINGNPGGLFFNLPVTVYPVATWGARVLVKPTESLYVMAGVYNGDPTLRDNDKHGVDFSMRGPLFTIGEIGYRLNQEKEATDLPGNYKVGGFYNAGTFPDQFHDVQGGAAAVSGLPARQQWGNGGFYFLLDQMIYRDGQPGSLRGLTSFASLLFSPDERINKMPFFANGGLVYRGPLAARSQDKIALGAMYGLFSSELRRSQRQSQGAGGPVQSYELALELTYIIQATRWLQIQPDLQYIINPGGTGKIPDALVIGFQLAINL